MPPWRTRAMALIPVTNHSHGGEHRRGYSFPTNEKMRRIYIGSEYPASAGRRVQPPRGLPQGLEHALGTG